MGRKAKHDIAPVVRSAFLRGFEKYCEEKGITRSDAMMQLIKDEGLLPVLNAVSKYAVRESEVRGSVDHNHRHSVESVSDTNQWISGLLESGTVGQNTKPRTN